MMSPPPGPEFPETEEATPPPLGAEAKVTAPKPPDIDWDDEDEATTVFDRSQEDSVRSLLRSAPPPPPGSLPALSRPPAPPPAAGMPAPSRVPPPPSPRPSGAPSVSLPRAPLPPPPRNTSSFPAPPIPSLPGSLPGAVPAPQPLRAATTMASEPISPFDRTGRKPIVWIGAAAAAVAIVGVIFALIPKQGSLVVTVAGPGNKSVSQLEVYVDGKKRCSESPCQVKDLSAGIHLVKVTAPSYQGTADQAVKISSGDEAVHNITLSRGSGGTGLSVRAEGRGLKLFVDGKEIGPLPQELPDLTPGDHVVKIDGGDRYEPFEKTITVNPDQLFTLEPKLKVKKGLATIKPGNNADGAKVVLVSGNERRPVPQLPLAVDIPVDKPYSIVATKRGFQDFQRSLEFEDGQAERTFVIDLTPALSVAAEPAHPTPSPAAPTHTPRPAAEPSPAPAVAKSSNGTLNLNSIPASNVILDGRPLGGTPKTNLSVPAGNHTVIFVHPEHGRKAKSVNVVAGKTVPVVVKFP